MRTLLFAALAACMSAAAQPTPITTGPEVGESIPAFEVIDSHGAKQSFDSLKGPNGLLLLFHRSADW